MLTVMLYHLLNQLSNVFEVGDFALLLARSTVLSIQDNIFSTFSYVEFSTDLELYGNYPRTEGVSFLNGFTRIASVM